MRKITLKMRLTEAFNAFKYGGHPVLVPMPPPPYEVRHPSICTIAGRVDYFHHLYMGGARKIEELDGAKARIAVEIGRELLRSGCITFTEDAQEMALFGMVRVLAPEEEANQ